MRGERIFLKLACNSNKAHPAVTSPGAVRAVISYLRERGAHVIAGDMAGVEHVRLRPEGRSSSTRAMMSENGLSAAIEESGAQLHCFDDTEWSDWFQPKLDFEHSWENQLWLPNILKEVDSIINLPRLGSHALAGYTCAIKNSVGWLRDDSRAHLHRRGDRFFELFAELNHCPILREKQHFAFTLGEKALVNIGPDIGSSLELGSWLALGARNLIAHDLCASGLLAALDEDEISFFDLYSPYPEDVDYWNRGLVEETWGEGEYQPLISTPRGGGLAWDRALSRLTRLQGERPREIKLRGYEQLDPGIWARVRAFSGRDLS